MPEIKGFKALRYNLDRVALADVIAPPYDVIDHEYQNELYDHSPYNIIRLILGREKDRYAEAAQCLQQWSADGILVREQGPAMYALEQTFKDLQGRMQRRLGFIAACRVDDFSEGSVLPHERTLSKPKEDRFRLLQATNTNFSQIFSLFQDQGGVVESLLHRVTGTPPLLAVDFEAVENKLWRIEEGDTSQAIMESMRSKTALIADGHHRYETALAYRDMMRMKAKTHTGQEHYEYTMMFFASMDADGLRVFSTHRVVHSLPFFDADDFLAQIRQNFHVEHRKSVEELVDSIAMVRDYSYGIITPNGLYSLRLKDGVNLAELTGSSIPPEVRELDVTLLHSYILERLLGIDRDAQEKKLNLDYLRTAGEVNEAVNAGRAQIGFLLNPTRLEQIRRVTRAGHTMPQKSTFFYPKLVSGLLMNPLD